MATKEKKNLGNIEEESEKQEAPTEVQNEKNRNGVLKDEVEKLRSDVDKISQELKSTVNELKKSIVDIRSAVSEIENPFNLLRSISSEEDLKKLNKKRLPPGVKSLVLGKPETEVAPDEEKIEQKPPSLDIEKPEPQPVTEPQPRPFAEPEIEEPKPQAKPSETHKIGTNYLDWVWSLLDSGMSADDVLQLAQAYEFMGYLPSKSSEHIYFLAVACEKVRSKGFSKNWMLLNMYKVAVTSGIKIGIDDVETIISVAEGYSGKRQAERAK